MAVVFPIVLNVKISRLRKLGHLEDNNAVIKYSVFYAGQLLGRPVERGVGACGGLLHVASFFSDYKDTGILIYWFSVQHYFEYVVFAILQVSATKTNTQTRTPSAALSTSFPECTVVAIYASTCSGLELEGMHAMFSARAVS